MQILKRTQDECFQLIYPLFFSFQKSASVAVLLFLTKIGYVFAQCVDFSGFGIFSYKRSFSFVF